MKRCVMAAFIKFRKQGGRGRPEEKQVAASVLSQMKTDIVRLEPKERSCGGRIYGDLGPGLHACLFQSPVVTDTDLLKIIMHLINKKNKRLS